MRVKVTLPKKWVHCGALTSVSSNKQSILPAKRHQLNKKMNNLMLLSVENSVDLKYLTKQVELSHVLALQPLF